MNLSELNFGFATVQWLVVTAVGIYSWLTARQAASGQELLELRTRIVALEEAIRHVPDQTAIAELLGDMRALRAELLGMQAIARSVDRINDYLLRDKA
ncbi:hypothetical protein D3C78_1345570 [compost metagenome]